MNVTSIIAALDTEIASLRKVREQLSALGTPDADGYSPKDKGAGKIRKTMSPEARAKIAAAQKRRWAKQKRSA